MNREILFRGMRVDNKEWVEGNLIYREAESPVPETTDLYKYYAIQEQDLNGNEYEVIPETVSFASSRQDENGKRIFHGDKVEFTVFDCFDHDTQFTGVVVWTGDKFIIQKGIDEPYYGSDGPFNLNWVCDQDHTIKIIGNVYDEKGGEE